MALRHSLEDLREMAEVHVHYELTHMALWSRMVTRDAKVNQALLEAYLTHVRNMHEFLTRRREKAYPDAVVAEDFFDEPWALSIDVLTVAQIDDIHRRLSHLSTGRLQRNTPHGGPFDWAGNHRLDRWARKVLKALGVFIGELDTRHSERAAWFKPSYAEVQSFLRS